MAETSIGIRIADGSFFPVLAEGKPAKKRVILTTVTDNQTGAQIDLYRGNGTGIAGGTYIGSLVIDEIERAPKGEPDIELVMKLDAEGNLEAVANEAVTGEHQTFSVAMDSIGGAPSEAIRDFDLDERYHPELGVSPAEATRLTAEPVSPDFSRLEDEVERQRRRRRARYLGIAILVVVVAAVAIALVLWFSRKPVPAAAAIAAPPASSSGSTTAGSGQTAHPPAPAEPAETAAGAPAAPSAAAQKPQYREGGVMYQIRWGDTLWDLSISFYRTPWLYGKIAKANNIKNPDLIFAHTEIYIPER